MRRTEYEHEQANDGGVPEFTFGTGSRDGLLRRPRACRYDRVLRGRRGGQGDGWSGVRVQFILRSRRAAEGILLRVVVV
jgi:hypothetical protein